MSNRIISIDIIRGIAIMGILLVNAPTLNGPPIMDAFEFAFQKTTWDIIYSQFITIFAMGKFYPIFALLFGISAAIFISRSDNKTFLTRQYILLLMGICHGLFVWWGDILTAYAILGMPLIFLNRKSPRFILNLLVVMVVFGLLLSVVTAVVPANKTLLYDINTSLVYQTGDFLAVSAQRMSDFVGVFLPGFFYEFNFIDSANNLLYFWQLLILFVAGYYLQVSGMLKKLTEDAHYSLNGLWFCLMMFLFFTMLSFFKITAEFASDWQPLSQGLLYGSLILNFCHHKTIKILVPFAQVGRMSLSNYLFHTISLSLLFYGYGLGLYGEIGPAAQLLWVIILMLSSIVMSNLWLKYFYFGPVEWLWRAATKGHFSPMVKREKSAVAF